MSDLYLCMIVWGAIGALHGIFEVIGYVAAYPLTWSGAHKWRRWLVLWVFLIGFALVGPFGSFLRRHI